MNARRNAPWRWTAATVASAVAAAATNRAYGEQCVNARGEKVCRNRRPRDRVRVGEAAETSSDAPAVGSPSSAAAIAAAAQGAKAEAAAAAAATVPHAGPSARGVGDGGKERATQAPGKMTAADPPPEPSPSPPSQATACAAAVVLPRPPYPSPQPLYPAAAVIAIVARLHSPRTPPPRLTLLSRHCSSRLVRAPPQLRTARRERTADHRRGSGNDGY